MTGRLNRAEMQQRNRAKVLAAARAEFVERGYRDTKIDVIAERAALTRGAVYSNFPGKRALYFAVLADELAADAVTAPVGPPGGTAREALGALARSWLGRLPLATAEDGSESRLGVDLIPEILADEHTRRPFAQLTRLNAILLGLALERLQPARTFRPRMVRVAEAALTVLHGAGQLAAAAPGFVDELSVVAACEHLADLDLADRWAPSYLPYVGPARPTDEPWQPPTATDALRAAPAHLADDGVLAVLGLHRLSAIEEAVRAAPAGSAITAVLVTSNPPELSPLARLTIADLAHHLRAAFPPAAMPPVQIVYDDTGTLAAAAGVTATSDATETAIRLRSGRIVARADGHGAGHAAAAIDNR